MPDQKIDIRNSRGKHITTYYRNTSDVNYQESDKGPIATAIDKFLEAIFAIVCLGGLIGIVWFFVSLNMGSAQNSRGQSNTTSTSSVGVAREVNTTNLSLRSGPGTNYAVITIFPRSSKLIEIKGVFQKADDGSVWIKVTTPNQEYEGWVNQKYIR